MSFLQYYFSIEGSGNEVAVCCPFPHTTPGSQQQYLEQHPSAHVNLEEGLFHCKACGRGMSEPAFIAEVLGCTYGKAMQIKHLCENEQDLYYWKTKALPLADESRQLLAGFTISDQVMADLQLSTDEHGAIGFPVFVHDRLLDIRAYRPKQRPKIRSREGAPAGLIIPYDLWRGTPLNRTTLICAGEKDMAVARSHGFNAITITGGETALPILLKAFKDRKVAIVYDNDAPGRMGAAKLARTLRPLCASVKNCTAFHAVCKEDKEDITDFFAKYHKTREDLIAYLEQTPEYEISEAELAMQCPQMDLLTASHPEHVGKTVRSNIQVVAVSEAAYVIPSVLLAEKWRNSEGKEDRMAKGQIKEWNLSEETVADILHLMDNGFTEEDLLKNYRKVLKINKDETYIRFRKLEKATVFKAYVTDLFETSDASAVPMEFTAYALHHRLESGKKYRATYKLVPHPYKGQQLIMLILAMEQADDSVTAFKVTPAVKDLLSLFHLPPGQTVGDGIQDGVERFKSFLGYNGNNLLITAMDLAYHTPLSFNFGSFRDVRAYLDTLIVGESRMGKSSTAEAMRKAYGLGAFVSLAGNAATIPGLVGGSNKTGGGAYQTRAGIIPQNHRGLIIFEELGKSNANITQELTDIRSSNEVRITRVSGTLTLPACVRMVTLSNVRPTDGTIKPIAAYPHGIAVLAELIGTAEDIARYDLALVLGDRGASSIDPFWEPREPHPLDAYRARVRWVWSRSANQIVIPPDVGKLVVKRANDLNRDYDSHIKIFGTEAWKKLVRVAIAVAGYLVSTDDSYERIILRSEHIEWAVEYLRAIYDNPVFKLKEYTEHERKYSQIDDDGVALLQTVFDKSPGMLLHLEQVPSTSKNALQAATGLDNDSYNGLMNVLVRGLFIVFSKYDIVPTQRFRLGMNRISRSNRITRLGEVT